MLYIDYLRQSLGLLFQPLKSLDEIYYKYRQDVFRYGLITFMLSVIIATTSLLLVNADAGLGFTAYMARIFWAVVISLLTTFIHLALINLLTGLYSKKGDLREVCGLFLAMEFPYFFLLPVSLIFRAVPFLSTGLFAFVYLVILVLVFVLKIKSLVRTLEISDAEGVLLTLLPVIISMAVGTLGLIVLISQIT